MKFYGVTNPGFVGAQAEYAVASATMIARKPLRLSHLEAASAPAVAVTAWQNAPRLCARSSAANSPDFRSRRKCRCVCGSAGGECRPPCVALVGSKDFEYVRGLGAETVIDYHDGNFESSVSPVDVVIDTVGGNTRDRSLHSRWHSGFGCFTDPFAIKLQRANSIFLS